MEGDIKKVELDKALKDLGDQVKREFVSIIEIFTRALLRIIILSDFGNSLELAYDAYDFIMLKDEDLGKTKY